VNDLPGRYPDKVGTLTQPLPKGEERTAPGTVIYAGAGPVIGGRIGFKGFADGSFTAGSSC
jgi:hypothetical protein